MIGLQFSNLFLALFPLGMHVIMPSKKNSGIFSVSKKLFIKSSKGHFNSSQKVLKNSFVNPSGPGLSLFLVWKIWVCSSFKFILSSNLELSSLEL